MSSADCGGGSTRCHRFSCTFTRVPLLTFIDLVGEGLFRTLPVRGVLAGSEAFPLGEQERFEREFSIKVVHWYGHSEYAVLAYLCRECRGFHFYPTYGQVELLASTTQGCQARLWHRRSTRSVLSSSGMTPAIWRSRRPGPAPLIISPGPTPSSGDPQETFVDSSGRRRALGPYLFGIHGSFWDHVRDLQFVQDRPGLLRVRFVTNPGADQDQIELTLLRRIPMARLEFEYVPVIARSPSGKRRYFVDGLRAAALRSPASQIVGEAPRRKARRPPAHRWLTAAAVVLAAAAAVMVLLAMTAGGGHPVTIRAHHARDRASRFPASVQSSPHRLPRPWRRPMAPRPGAWPRAGPTSPAGSGSRRRRSRPGPATAR